MQTSTDIAYWLAVTRIEGVGPIRLRRWLDYFGDIKTLFTTSREELQRAGLTALQISGLKNPNWHKVEKDLAWCQKVNCHLLTCLDEHYPRLLKECVDAPFMLFVRGDVSLLAKTQLAIVGSRNPTASGCETAEQFAAYLAQANLVITSGLALGIDAASHRGALQVSGKTIAVLGTGLQHIYPASHNRLANQIIDQGALVSELPPDMPPKAKHFPMRNRIISGLSMGVLVIEAAMHSGSLITARFASEQGRNVFAIPGSIHNPLARGCHYLIQQGAKLIETAADILEELGALKAIVVQDDEKLADLDEKQRGLLSQIGYETTALDAIIVRCGLTPSEVSSMLLSLELAGYVTMVPGGYLRNC